MLCAVTRGPIPFAIPSVTMSRISSRDGADMSVSPRLAAFSDAHLMARVLGSLNAMSKLAASGAAVVSAAERVASSSAVNSSGGSWADPTADRIASMFPAATRPSRLGTDVCNASSALRMARRILGSAASAAAKISLLVLAMSWRGRTSTAATGIGFHAGHQMFPKLAVLNASSSMNPLTKKLCAFRPVVESRRYTSRRWFFEPSNLIG